MNVSINKNEYKTLLEMLEIANWVINAHRTDDEPRTKKFRDMEQKFFALAKDMGFADFFEYDSEMKAYIPTIIYDETIDVFDYIDEYDDDTFWDELCDRLAYRDLVRQKGEEAVEKMEPPDRFADMEQIRSVYFDEFLENGLERIILQK